MTTTFDAIRALIVRDFELPAEQLRRDTLLEEIELDSLAITELVFSIEDEFKITAENTIPPFKTLGDIADYVARLIAERDAKPPQVAVKPAAAPDAFAEGAASPATAKPPRSRRKKASSSGNGAAPEAPERAARAQSARGKSGRRTDDGAPKDSTARRSGRAKITRAVKRPARAASSEDVPPRSHKRSGGSRAGARAR